jgi:hypothetical protein
VPRDCLQIGVTDRDGKQIVEFPRRASTVEKALENSRYLVSRKIGRSSTREDDGSYNGYHERGYPD